MKRIFLFLFLVSSFSCFSQQDAWVYFKDKPDSATFFNNPLSELSQRALDRRTNQNIVLDLKDIPIHPLYISQIKNSNGITVLAKSKWFSPIKASPTAEYSLSQETKRRILTSNKRVLKKELLCMFTRKYLIYRTKFL